MPGIRSALTALAAGLPVSALAQPRVEFTKDGRLLPVLTSRHENTGTSASDSAPFALTPFWTLPLRRQVGSVRIADLNGDGINDLAVGCYISSSFPPYNEWRDMIFFGTGAGLPAAPSWTSADQVHTGDTQIGDINGDGRLDLVAITGGTAFSPPRIYFGQPTGGPSTSPGWLAAPPTPGWSTGGLLFDADNDQDLDLLVTNQGLTPNPYRPMYLYLNNTGSLSTTPAWISAESSIQNTAAAADFDGNGFPDVAVSKWVNFESGRYANSAAGLTTAPDWTVGSTGADRGVAAADIDGNGTIDLAFGGPDGTRLYSNAGGVFTHAYTSTPPFNSVQEILLVDVDADGDKDLVEVHFGDGRTHVFLNNAGSLSQTPDWTFDAAEVANAIAVGDLNGDGVVDLAVGYSGDTCVRIFLGTAPPPCYPNCDHSTIAPILNIQDFGCFLNAFAAGDSYANCDGSTTPPILNVQDFGCFLNAFAAGCP
jgi:hypothetical protein